MTKKKIGRLCIITNTELQKRFSHEDIVKLAIRGGADMIQLRDKKMSTGELVVTAKRIKKLCDKSNVTFIVNDRVDIALISDADGVHLGKEDIPVSEARKLLGRNKIIGGTAHNVKEALQVEKDGVDYIGFGHIFPTLTKLKTTQPQGLERLAEVIRLISIPVLAIGGINTENVNKVILSGAYGVALIGSVVKSDNPVETVSELRKIIYG
ncbi:MAG: thiamine phosphate synthase [Ignavibacteria bacterium]